MIILVPKMNFSITKPILKYKTVFLISFAKNKKNRANVTRIKKDIKLQKKMYTKIQNFINFIFFNPKFWANITWHKEYIKSRNIAQE